MIIILLTCLAGTYFAFKKRINAFLFLFLFSLFLMPLTLFLFEAAWFQFKGYVPIYLTGILFLCNANDLFFSDIFKKNLSSFSCIIFFLFVALTISTAINNYSLINALAFFKNYFWPFLLYITIVSLGYTNLNIRKYIAIFVIMQIGMAIIQYLGGDSFSRSFYFDSWIKGDEIVTVSKSITTSKGVLITGTLGKVTNLGIILAICITYLFGSKTAHGEKNTTFDHIIIAAAVLVVIFTGVRAALMTCIIGLLLNFVFISGSLNKSLRRICVILLFAIITLPVLVGIGADAIRSNADYSNTLHRSLSLFGVLGEIFGDDSASHLYTLRRSVNISQFLNIKTFFFGSGIYTTDVKGYGPGIHSISDAQLLFTIVEFGIFTLIVCVLPHLYCLKDINRYCDKPVFKLSCILFVVIFLQTVVDAGMFFDVSSFLVFLLYANEGLIINEESLEQRTQV